jgi:hypothetical protein
MGTPGSELRRSRQKPRFLPAVDEVMSGKIAAGDFAQLTTVAAQAACFATYILNREPQGAGT